VAWYKVNFLFGFGKQGWSETYYHQATANVDVVNFSKALAQERKRLMAYGPVLEAIRVSDDAVKGDAQLIPSNIVGTGSVGDMPCDKIETAWYVRLEAGFFYRRQLHLRGLPDDWTTSAEFAGPGIWQPTPAFKAAAERFCAYVVDNQWLIRVKQRGAENEDRLVTNAVRDDNDIWTITGDFADWPQFGKCIGLRDLEVPQLYGEQRYVATAVNTIKIQPKIGGGAWGVGGHFRLVKIVYEDITTAALIRASNRKTGRPFFLTRGRASNRVTE